MLEVKGLCKSFGDLHVLKNIDLSMDQGEVLAIIGASGGGKTTLLRCINFLETPDSGSMTVGGETVSFPSADDKAQAAAIKSIRLKIGMGFQQFNLFPQYTVLRNVTLAPSLLKRGTPEAIEENAVRILTGLGLGEKLESYPGQLSGGQQQRVAIARALALDPQILCFDEPTSALDPALTGEVVKVVKKLKEASSTMLIVTHDMEFAHAVADRVVFMADGRVEESADVEEFFSSPKSEKAKLFLSMGPGTASEEY
ncbi:MAG: amino acid ABC transporter ATP-binding protein [Clostridia bacterium]|nr:amino acid ABC transporter ATP-binding protein [Clostridia bacterium]